MNRKIKIISIIVFLAIASNAYAFTFVDTDAFKPQPNKIIRFITKVWECKWHRDCYNKFGAFTTLNSGDTLSAFPTTYNANLTKTIEIGTTSVQSITTLGSLATTSTIVSGTWNATVITPTYGGTGWATVTVGALLYGNGTTRFGTTSAGTNGQVLALVAGIPTWQSASFDAAANYVLTGGWAFNASTTLTASSTVTGTGTTTLEVPVSIAGSKAEPLSIRGQYYNFPQAQGASSTALINNGSGSLVWSSLDWELLASSTLTANAGTSSATVAARKAYKVIWSPAGASAVSLNFLRFNSDSATNYGHDSYERYANINSESAQTAIALDGNVGTTSPGSLLIFITNTSSQRKFVTWTGGFNSTGSAAPRIYTGEGVWNNTSSQITEIIFTTKSQTATFTAGTTLIVFGTKD